jgi:short-subunit dehydrogenase
MTAPHCIVITGASSGIGAALALQYAAPGVTLILIARNETRLATIATAARAKGATVEAASIDTRDTATITTYLTTSDTTHPIDLLIANAGVLEGRTADGTIEDFATAARVIEINLLGALATTHAILPAMRGRKRGHIALVSSLAAFSPLTDAPAYSASKSGLLSYGLALRAALAGTGVTVSVACPGYVESAMTDSHIGEQPMKLKAPQAATLIARGIAANHAVIGFPRPLYLGSLLSTIIPEPLRLLFTKSMRFHVATRPPVG